MFFIFAKPSFFIYLLMFLTEVVTENKRSKSQMDKVVIFFKPLVDKINSGLIIGRYSVITPMNKLT